MGKVKKYDLTFDEEQPFEIYGISSAFADYRLTWELNQVLGIHLEKTEESFEVFQTKTKSNQQFRYFFYEDQELLTKFFLVKNKQEQQQQIQAWLNQWMRQALKISKLQNTMDRLSDEAVANGLTPEILQAIIDE